MNNDDFLRAWNLKYTSDTEYLSNPKLHDKVVTNIIRGCKEWSPEELQHYQNFNKEVERSINYYRTGVPVLEDGSVYQFDMFSIYVSSKNYVKNNFNKHFVRNRCFNAAAICGIAAICINGMEDFNDTYVAVVIADNNCTDVVVLEIGSRVYEVKGSYGGEHVSLEMACEMAWRICSDEVPKIDYVFFMGNQVFDISKQQMVRSKFKKLTHCYAIYHDLLKLGCLLYQGVLQGDVTDLLILNAVSMPIGLRVVRNKQTVAMISVFDERTTVPTKNTIRLNIDDRSCPGVEMEILQGDFFRNEPNRLWELKTIGRFMIDSPKKEVRNNDYEVTVEIGGTNSLYVEVRAPQSDELLPIKQLPYFDEFIRIDVPVILNSIQRKKITIMQIT